MRQMKDISLSCGAVMWPIGLTCGAAVLPKGIKFSYGAVAVPGGPSYAAEALAMDPVAFAMGQYK